MIFIDTGAFLARYLSNDQHHHEAVALWDDLGTRSQKCMTSNFVLDETFALLGRRAGTDFTVQRATHIYASRMLTIARPDFDDEINALRFFQKYADQKVSFTDCISFVLMRRLNITNVFTFDNHFAYAGFSIIQ